MAIAGCSREDTPAELARFCQVLDEVNKGAVNTEGLAELDGHVRVISTLLEASPPSLHADLAYIHDTIDAWASAVSGEQPMIETFGRISDPALVGSEGRVTDFIALHCGADLGGRPWNEGGRPSARDLCPGWPRVGTPLTFNYFPNLPDIAGSNYFSNSFLISKWAARFGIDTLRGAFVVEPGGRVEFRGQYPQTRYFAYHPNDMDLNNLPTLRDRDLEPDAGSRNPFREVVGRGEENYYTASLVFGPKPARPELNTSYVGLRKDGVTPNRFVMNLMRMYHIDIGNGAGSGAVPLPAVSIYGADGQLQKQFDECELFAEGAPELRSDRAFPSLPVIDHRPRNPPRWTTSSNFDAPSDTLANADVQYLATHYSQRFGNLLVVRGKYLSAPDTRAGESPAAPGRQVRLYNLCTYNFWNGSAVQCLLENDLARDADGYYTLVVSSADNRPGNLEAQAATWLDWGPFLDGQLQYRFVYRENPYVAAIAAAVEGETVDESYLPFVPVAVPCDRASFEAEGWRGCMKP